VARTHSFAVTGPNSGKFQRQAAGSDHATLDRLEQFGEMPVAIIEPDGV
jgi:hypothetical protein